MNDQNHNEVFSFSYSASEQEEIRSIRAKYLPKEETTIDRLRALDESVTRKGTVVSLIVGILGTLILGSGMSCIMVGSESLFVPGIVVGLIGIAGIAAAYPLFARITKKERERLAPEILRLTEELLK